MDSKWLLTSKATLFHSRSFAFRLLQYWKMERFNSSLQKMGNLFFHQVWRCTQQTARRSAVLPQWIRKYSKSNLLLWKTLQTIRVRNSKTPQKNANQPLMVVIKKKADILRLISTLKNDYGLHTAGVPRTMFLPHLTTNAPNSISAGVLPYLPLKDLTALPV